MPAPHGGYNVNTPLSGGAIITLSTSRFYSLKDLDGARVAAASLLSLSGAPQLAYLRREGKPWDRKLSYCLTCLVKRPQDLALV